MITFRWKFHQWDAPSERLSVLLWHCKLPNWIASNKFNFLTKFRSKLSCALFSRCFDRELSWVDSRSLESLSWMQLPYKAWWRPMKTVWWKPLGSDRESSRYGNGWKEATKGSSQGSNQRKQRSLQSKAATKRSECSLNRSIENSPIFRKRTVWRKSHIHSAIILLGPSGHCEINHYLVAAVLF